MSRSRLARLRVRLQDKRLDALLVSSLPNIRYLTGFTGSNGLCIVTRHAAYFLTDSRYVQQSRLEVTGFRRIPARTTLLEAAVEHSLLKRCRMVGFESHAVTYAAYKELRRHFPTVVFLPTSDLVEDLSIVKEDLEIEAIRTAVRISDRVFQEILEMLRPGIAELDLAAEISYLQKRYGAEGDAFEPLVASGERGAMPHGRASAKRIRKGEFVTLDYGCIVNGYRSDLSRTVLLGRPATHQRRMYGAVLDAQCAAIDAAHPSMWAKDLDAVARRRLRTSGFGKYFIHALGHGLGLHVHERPRVSALSKERLSARHVITIEPGVYVAGEGGVRIEDDIVITEDGCRVLTTAPKELITL